MRFSLRATVPVAWVIVFIFYVASQASKVNRVAENETPLLVTTTIPDLTPSTKFACRVRVQETTAWVSAFVFESESGTKQRYEGSNARENGYFESLQGWTNNWVAFEVDPNTAVEIEITKLYDQPAPIHSASPHPNDRGTVTLVGGVAMLRLHGPTQMTIDIDRQLDGRNTGSTDFGNGAAMGLVTHSFHVFANPMLPSSGPGARPDPNGASVRTVSPGETPPEDFEEDTLYFLPGVHRPVPIPACCLVPMDESSGCVCHNGHGQGGKSQPGYSRSFKVRSNKNYYIPTDAWLDGWIEADTPVVNVRIFGYGVISGRLFQRRGIDNQSPKGIVMWNSRNTTFWGVTLVDGSNHHLLLSQNANFPELPNTMAWVKILGWRTNGDGFQIWNYWRPIHDIFLRTQDDCMYLGGASGINIQFSRITTWNDANGVPWIFSAGNGAGHNIVLQDSDVLYHRKAWPYWCGGIFDLRSTNTSIHNITVRNIRITDPFPTCPLFHIQGGMSDVHFENIDMLAHSAVNMPNWACRNRWNRRPQDRFDLPAGNDCSMPYGIPNRFTSSTLSHPRRQDIRNLDQSTIFLRNLSFSNVTIAGQSLADLHSLGESGRAVVVKGNVEGFSW
jgi:hypothetical protein